MYILVGRSRAASGRPLCSHQPRGSLAVKSFSFSSPPHSTFNSCTTRRQQHRRPAAAHHDKTSTSRPKLNLSKAEHTIIDFGRKSIPIRCLCVLHPTLSSIGADSPLGKTIILSARIYFAFPQFGGQSVTYIMAIIHLRRLTLFISP